MRKIIIVLLIAGGIFYREAIAFEWSRITYAIFKSSSYDPVEEHRTKSAEELQKLEELEK